MGSRRFILASIAAGLLFTAAVEPALAKKPDPAGSDERPLTAQEQAASDRRAAAAERYVESSRGSGGGLAPLACLLAAPTESLDPASLESFTGDGAPAEGTTGTGETSSLTGSDEAILADGTESTVMAEACAVPQGFIAVEARDQIFGHYCGPAVGQVIANYSWAMPAGANKYLQRQIAGWMSTDINGGTHAFAMEAGLERGTAGSPRRPANWDWIVTVLRDTDGDGWVGDQLDAYVRSNISHSRMPLAIPVKPHDPNSPSGAHLLSWPNPVWSVGHWVAIYGWVGIHDGTDRARMYYTDSSRDEGGATGKFWTPTRWFTLMILEHTRRFVW